MADDKKKKGEKGSRVALLAAVLVGMFLMPGEGHFDRVTIFFG